MTNNNFTPILVLLIAIGVIFFLLGGMIGEITSLQKTEEQTVVYCMEQPSACKVKYEFYKLENAK
jgi:hypothetical protein